jgi:hypothetical protein
VAPLLLTWALEARAVHCAGAIPLSDIDQALTEAESAYRDLDDTAFRDRTNTLAGLLLPCVTTPVPPQLAARYQRVMALHLQAIGDEAGADGALRAAKARDPEYRFDDALLPPTSSLRLAYESAPTVQRVHRVAPPRSGSLAFDGINGRLRPKDDPVLVQVLDANGVALETSYLGPGAPLPPYEAVPRMRRALLATSAVSFAFGIATTGLAWTAHETLYGDASEPRTSDAILDADRARTNRLATIGMVGISVGIGAGAGALVVGDR